MTIFFPSVVLAIFGLQPKLTETADIDLLSLTFTHLERKLEMRERSVSVVGPQAANLRAFFHVSRFA